MRLVIIDVSHSPQDFYSDSPFIGGLDADSLRIHPRRKTEAPEISGKESGSLDRPAESPPVDQEPRSRLERFRRYGSEYPRCLKRIFLDAWETLGRLERFHPASQEARSCLKRFRPSIPESPGRQKRFRFDDSEALECSTGFHPEGSQPSGSSVGISAGEVSPPPPVGGYKAGWALRSALSSRALRRGRRGASCPT